jgi:hypothetical protein
MRAGGAVDADQPLLTRLRGRLYELYMKLPRGRLNRSRDLRIVHQALLATGRVTWIGEEAGLGKVRTVGDEMTRTLNRLRGLLALPQPQPRPTVADSSSLPAEVGLAAAPA